MFVFVDTAEQVPVKVRAKVLFLQVAISLLPSLVGRAEREAAAAHHGPPGAVLRGGPVRAGEGGGREAER